MLGTACNYDGTGIIKKRDCTNHHGARIPRLRLCKPRLPVRDDNTVHDSWIIAKEPKSKATNGGDRRRQYSLDGMSYLTSI